MPYREHPLLVDSEPFVRPGGWLAASTSAFSRSNSSTSRSTGESATSSIVSWKRARSCAVVSPTSGMASACSQRASGRVRARSRVSTSLAAFFAPKTRGSSAVPRFSVASCSSGHVEEIQRLLHQPALDQLIRHDPAEPLDIERAALGEVLQAARLLRRDSRRCSRRSTRQTSDRAAPARRTPGICRRCARGNRTAPRPQDASPGPPAPPRESPRRLSRSPPCRRSGYPSAGSRPHCAASRG